MSAVMARLDRLQKQQELLNSKAGKFLEVDVESVEELEKLEEEEEQRKAELEKQQKSVEASLASLSENSLTSAGPASDDTSSVHWTESQLQWFADNPLVLPEHSEDVR
jgi:DNA-binding protein H-NS